MGKVYMIYVSVPTDIFNTRLKYLLSSVSNYDYRHKKNEKYLYGFYAWTKDKKILSEFLDTRYADTFDVIKKDLDNDELEEFKSVYNYLKLNIYEYKYNKNLYESESEKMVTTRHEYIQCTNYLTENLINFYEERYITIDYKIFNDDIQNALDILGYTTIYDTNIDKSSRYEDDEIRRLRAEKKQLQNKTVFGHELIHYYNNEYAGLLYLYSYLFFGR